MCVYHQQKKSDQSFTVDKNIMIFNIEQVYSIPIGGMCVRMPFTIGGSGSTYIYGYADSNYKEGMTKQECLQFCTNGMSIDDNIEINDVYISRVKSKTFSPLENKTHPIR